MDMLKRLKPVPVIVTLVIIVAITGSLAFLISNVKKNEKSDNKANVSINKTNLKAEEVSTAEKTTVKDTEVEVLFEDTAAQIGTQFKVTALVSPDDNQNGLRWTSSDSSVFEVDASGVVTIKGVGTATLTATVGTVTDAVVIEGISTIASGSTNDFPVYTQTTGGTGTSSGTSSGKGGSSTTVVVENPTSAVTEKPTSTPKTETPTKSSTTTQNPEIPTTEPGTTATDTPSGSTSSEDIGDVISGSGFSQTVSNVYVCQENGVYYGEIIVQSNVTIFYIKQRSASFDAKIQSVIESILPGNSANVWNNYLSASTDRTFTIDGRTVRIVVATGGGHSQIVIYN